MGLDVGADSTQVCHPFVSGEAWFRSQPSAGTRVTVAYNNALQRYEFVAYAQTAEQATKRLDRYKNKKSLYRPLQEGEHELMSSGTVNEFWGSRPTKTGRAGAVTWTYDGDKLEAAATAPTHIKRGHRSQTDRIGNEIRFGVVKRPTGATSEVYALTAPFSNPALDMYSYAYEYLIQLSNDNDAPLIDFREGEVYDNNLIPGIPFAKPTLAKKTKLPLRSRKRYYATLEPGGLPVADMSTDIEIDCLGNMSVVLSDTALLGYNLSVPTGAISIDAGLDAKLISNLAMKIASTVAGVVIDAALDAKLSGGMNTKISSGLDTKIDAGKNMSLKAALDMALESVTMKLSASAAAEIHGGAGLTLTGALGKTGRIINTLQQDYLTGLPTFIDPTLTS
jgi:hypothetical protein